MSGHCVIFAGGVIDAAQPEIPQDCALICADRGLLTARRLGKTPDYIVGDFDSLGCVPDEPGAVVYPSQKDDTDTMLAVKYACDKGYDTVEIYGGLGGRLDHTVANLQTLLYMAERGVYGVLIDGQNRVTMQTGGMVRQYRRCEGWYFSLLSFSEECHGVHVKGTEYLLHGAVLRQNFPLGVSNRITEEFAEVWLEEGALLVVQSKDAEPNCAKENIMG